MLGNQTHESHSCNILRFSYHVFLLRTACGRWGNVCQTDLYVFWSLLPFRSWRSVCAAFYYQRKVPLFQSQKSPEAPARIIEGSFQMLDFQTDISNIEVHTWKVLFEVWGGCRDDTFSKNGCHRSALRHSRKRGVESKSRKFKEWCILMLPGVWPS